ncbi:MAG: bifunctional dTDP-4-dehydrorhamnose 3,5-epimerase family protein/NAD(P)-dependent oxidoreductase [Candidatus Ancillula sp.]|jgi:dTDP-4-dehydrorhamnose 3,5-epimerase|nr:bifunctional dTDP-4-dehydrorhamnose 3,5-epimerase family protein/NAD(P)-dependent oxidoreductase [Candidatus Ancillula sp.]
MKIEKTPIDGVVVIELDVHGDNRGWFKENWQVEKLSALNYDFKYFKPIQNNISFNAQKGVTRGIHAEPWNKYISVGFGSVFGAWVDLRENSKTYGKTFTTTLTPDKAIFIPRGVANSFQALEDNTVYTYLVDAHWSADLQKEYTFVNLKDPELNIQWPIPLTLSDGTDNPDVELSEKDKNHPYLKDVVPMPPKKILITGANGQLGRAIQNAIDLSNLILTDLTDSENIQKFDFTNPEEYNNFDWTKIGTIINCAAWTNVDGAETNEGRLGSWKSNAFGPNLLAKIATRYNITLIHISSDYVFDGTIDKHLENEPFSPLGIYGQTKAAGDLAVSTTQKHYIIRTSWVIGDGNNFVKTFQNLASKNIKPSVVNDQFGRLTFTSTLADAIKHLLTSKADYGTYNVTNSGKTVSWFEIAQKIYSLCGHQESEVSPISTQDYYQDKDYISPRPSNSTLSLDKIISTGFEPSDWENELNLYCK